MTTTQSVIASITLAEASLLDATVLRTRGELIVVAIPDAATDSDVLGLGLIVVSAAALSVGGTSVPGPIADVSNDGWLWHRFVGLDAAGDTAVDASSNASVVRVEIDAKAMRRMPQDWALVLMGELTSGDFAQVTVTGGVRTLLGT